MRRPRMGDLGGQVLEHRSTDHVESRGGEPLAEAEAALPVALEQVVRGQGGRQAMCRGHRHTEFVRQVTGRGRLRFAHIKIATPLSTAGTVAAAAFIADPAAWFFLRSRLPEDPDTR